MSQQFTWGPPSQQPDGRRPLPISTSASAQARESAATASRSPSRTSFPSLAAASSILAPGTRRTNSRNSSTSSSSLGAFSSSNPGAQQQAINQLLSSGRSRNTVSSSNPLTTSSAAGGQSAPYAGGAGSSSGGGVPKLARGSPSLSQSSGVGSPIAPNSSAITNSQSLDKILIAQVSLLLGSIPKEDQDKAGFDGKIEQIRKLIATSGMDVFTKYFRRILTSNAAIVFSNNTKSADASPTYHLLQEEMRKLRIDPSQAEKIAASIDTTETDLFKDFDLAGLLDHFKLDPGSRISLALALQDSSKQDLRSKAEKILVHAFTSFVQQLTASEPADEISPVLLAHILESLHLKSPRGLDSEMQQNFERALHRRYETQQIPPEVSAALEALNLLQRSALVRLVQKAGVKATASVQSCTEMLASAEVRDINYTQVADTLIYIVLSERNTPYNLSNFVNALREHKAGKHLDWQDVIHAIDREGLNITKAQFLKLFNALLPLAHEYENFDIQLLWGGRWRNTQTQLAFVVAFLTCTPEELDISTIPRLRRAFDAETFQNSSTSIQEYAASTLNHPLVSLDATAALFNIIFQSRDIYDIAQQLGIPETVINPNTQVFTVTAAAVAKPWGGLQDQALRQLLGPFVEKQLPHYDFVLDGLWKQDSQWLADKLCHLYRERHAIAFDIYAHAREYGWLESLIKQNTELSLDLASCAHGEDALDIGAWANETMQAIPDILPKALSTFLAAKAEAEMQSRQGAPIVEVPLHIKTVYVLLGVLEGHLPDEEIILELQRQCLLAYPRLINYGESDKVNGIIERNSLQGHALPAEVDDQMTEYFKRLYRGEMQVREYIELLQQFKQSEIPSEQDLFASMINGLFEEYSCFGEYPLEALATTAVLFGSVINFNLLERIALQAALAMVLKAVQDHPAEDNMYKFGLQASINFSERLREWPTFCDRLVRVPQLRGTEVWEEAEKVAQVAQEQSVNGNGFTNGNIDALMAPERSIPHFTCVNADIALHQDHEEPNEDTQDKVLFVLNNISERNLQDKSKELKEVLRQENHAWFAQYLVEERAKSQQNFHGLYLSMLTLLNDRTLWTEVLRETYISIKRLVNSETIVNNTMDRTNLKNLGSWLGSLTLARDKPIKHKNISFKDLLIEGQETQRLTVVVPFTCKVLTQASQSTVFKPPNPWLMDIVGILKELYEHFDIKLNLKFEIEVLCKEFDITVADIEASDTLRMKPLLDDEFTGGVMSLDGHAGFADIGLLPLGSARREASGRFSQNAILDSLPAIGEQLVYPPASSRAINGASQNHIFLNAVQQAIAEIITPVVERSVTIAAISAGELVNKDFAMEADVARYKEAATSIVKALSGSLALVTCKEPLRMSITNNIRLLARDMPEQALPEGLVIMFVNDNLDTICKLVEESAEAHSIAEVERVITEGIAVRERWLTSRTGDGQQDFSFPQPTQWAYYVPEPYKQQLGGLNRDQLSVYEDFGHNIRGLPSTHGATPSVDAARQIADVVSESQFPAMPNLPTPAGVPAVPNHTQLPQRTHGNVDLYDTNGAYGDVPDTHQHVFANLRRAAQESTVDRVNDLALDSPIRELYDRIVMHMDSALLPQRRDEICRTLAWNAMSAMFVPTSTRLEVEVMASVLQMACQLSIETNKIVVGMLGEDNDDLLHAPAAICLIQNDLIDVRRIDELAAQVLRHEENEHIAKGVQFLADMADEMLMGANGNDVFAFRTDFAQSFEALTQLMINQPDHETSRSLVEKLSVPTRNVNGALPSNDAKQDQAQYIFEEWIRLQRSTQSSPRAVTAFVRQLHEQSQFSSIDQAAVFFRTCIELSVTNYEEELRTTNNVEAAFTHTDALASLVIALLHQQSCQSETGKVDKATYFDGQLALLIMCMSKYQHEHSENFPQKVFYRLFGSLILELRQARPSLNGSEDAFIHVYAKALLALQPRFFPAFTFGWVGLLSHRAFIPAILRGGDQTRWSLYMQLIELLLKHSTELNQLQVSQATAKDLYRAVLRILLTLHHDFPEFVAENHIRLCNAIPSHCTQLRNLVISAYPSTYPELPDPFQTNLKVDRIDDLQKDPVVRYDFEADLNANGIKTSLDILLSTAKDGAFDERAIARINKACTRSPRSGSDTTKVPNEVHDRVLLTAIIMTIATRAIAERDGDAGGSTTFNTQGSHVRALLVLIQHIHPDALYHALSAMADQLRFPNSHTQWFSSALLHFFTPEVTADFERSSSSTAEGSFIGSDLDHVQQQVTRVLLERLLVHRPHPWGLIITLLELLKNEKLGFWNLEFVKANPEVSEFVQQMVNIGPRQGSMLNL